ncbi:MAG: 4Fe-4S binding protein [Dehalococcoidales bacterium]|nr:4Fe-4S binding protein [Dehalococcoidales bacterium]
MKTRQKIRLTLVFLSLLLFPITLNFFSPYISIDGALSGIISGSLIVFFVLFISGIFFGRAWCGWACPIAGLSEIGEDINNKPAPVRKLTLLRYGIFTIWFSVVAAGFILAGGIKGVDPLHLSDSLVSVDEPAKYIIYYLVLFVFFGLTVVIGKRAGCHSICWMSPFLAGGCLSGKVLRIPRLRILSNPSNCIHCRTCDEQCPMSIPVSSHIQTGRVGSLDCILCGQCVDGCPNKVLAYGLRR